MMQQRPPSRTWQTGDSLRYLLENTSSRCSDATPVDERHACRRAYEAVKAQHVGEAARRAEDERLIDLLYAEEAEARDQQHSEEHAQAQAEQRALMLAANQEQLRLKAR